MRAPGRTHIIAHIVKTIEPITASRCRLARALDEVVVDGIDTTLPLFRALVREKDIIDGNYHIHWLEQFLLRGGLEGAE